MMLSDSSIVEMYNNIYIDTLWFCVLDTNICIYEAHKEIK